MTIVRRADQQESSPMQGGRLLTMAGSLTGATMATVGDLTVQPGVRSAYHLHPNTEESIFVVDGEIKIRPLMYLALSYDHRIIDGKDSVSFLKTIKENLEDPRRLFLEI